MITIEYDDKEMRGLFNRLKKKFSDLTGVLNDIGSYLVSSTQKRINKGILPANAPLTVSVKRGDKTLRDTGRLLSSISYRVEKDGVCVGTNVRYAVVHQFGATIKPKTAEKLAIPASWETRRYMRRYGASVRSCISQMKRDGWHIWFTERAIMGKKRGKQKVLWIRKSSVSIPKREFLTIDDDDRRLIVSKLSNYLMGA